MWGAPIDFEIRSTKQLPGSRSLINTVGKSLHQLTMHGPEESMARIRTFFGHLQQDKRIEHFQTTTPSTLTPIEEMRRTIDEVDFYKKITFSDTRQMPLSAAVLDTETDLMNITNSNSVTIFEPLVPEVVYENTEDPNIKNMNTVFLSMFHPMFGFPLAIHKSIKNRYDVTNDKPAVVNYLTLSGEEIPDVVVGGYNASPKGGSSYNGRAFASRAFDMIHSSGSWLFQNANDDQGMRLFFKNQVTINKIFIVRKHNIHTFELSSAPDSGQTLPNRSPLPNTTLIFGTAQSWSPPITTNGEFVTVSNNGSTGQLFQIALKTSCTGSCPGPLVPELQLYQRKNVPYTNAVSLLKPLYDRSKTDLSALSFTVADISKAKTLVLERINYVDNLYNTAYQNSANTVSPIYNPYSRIPAELAEKVRADTQAIEGTVGMAQLAQTYAYYRKWLDNPVLLENNPEFNPCLSNL